MQIKKRIFNYGIVYAKNEDILHDRNTLVDWGWTTYDLAVSQGKNYTDEHQEWPYFAVVKAVVEKPVAEPLEDTLGWL
jgi:hypothetical protein